VIVFRERSLCSGIAFGALDRLALALTLVIFIGIEQLMQPRQHLLDGWELAGRSRFSARTPLALNAWFTLRARLASFALLARLSRLAL
jgi:hypothetical protein